MADLDLQGRVCIVTGANTGIGRVTAADFARRGAHVFLACRSARKTEPVVVEIRAETRNEAVEFLPLDLGDFDSIRACVAAFTARGLPLHILVANAGLASQRGLTQSGFELAFGVNHVGHALLIRLLLGVMRASAPARVVIVSSRAHTRVKAWDLGHVREATQGWVAFGDYSTSKLANLYFARALARRLEGSGVTVYALHPGVVASDIWRRIPQPFRWLATRSMITVEEGAQTQIRCATDPALAEQTGLYYVEGEPAPISALAADDANGEDLWRRTAEWIGLPETI